MKTDTERRIAAEACFQQAKLQEKSNSVAQQEIQLYQDVIKNLTSIHNKNHEDYRNLSNSCRDLAIIFFNQKNFITAQDYYQQSIQHLLFIISELNDSDYRNLTGLYFDLADTFSELEQFESAHQAVNYAILAFNRIKEKDHEEQSIADPIINFKQVHTLFENRTSFPNHFENTTFKNLQILFDQTQQMNACHAQLANIGMDDTNMQLQSTPALGYVSIHQSYDVHAHRQSAKQFLAIADSHIREGNVVEALDACQQAMKLFKSILDCDKTEDDRQIIYKLTETMNSLQQYKAFRNESSPSSGSASSVGMFSLTHSTNCDKEEDTDTEEMEFMDIDQCSP